KPSHDGNRDFAFRRDFAPRVSLQSRRALRRLDRSPQAAAGPDAIGGRMTTTANNSLSLFSLLDALRRRKFMVIIPAVLLTAGFAVYGHFQPDRYRATAVIAAAQTAPPEYLRRVAPPPLNIEDYLWTVREVLFSDPLLQAAARESKAYQGIQDDLSPQ